MKSLKISREIRIGLLTIITLTAFIWGFNFLKGKNIFSTQRVFYAEYENVAGLMTANAVTINGLSVGQVSAMHFHPDKPGIVVVELSMSNNVRIPKNSVARIFSSDLLGTRGIQILPGDSHEDAKSGDTLISQMQSSLQDEVNDMVQPIMAKAEKMMTSIDTVLSVISDVFNKQTRDNLVNTVESLRNTMNSLENATRSADTLMTSQKIRLARIIANVESISTNLKQNNENLSKVMANAASISDTIAQARISVTLRNLNQSVEGLSNVVGKIERGEGSLGQLVNNDKMYTELEKSSNELKLLLEDMRLNPQRYVHFSVFGRGGKRNAYSPPDTSANRKK
ncbi:MAG: MCE family protein [Bacteroidetes bacterium HGW-Bacteroidetes-9]|jgi:phospholipid/cholesterol/gamma-HCH transport system substrate-binding protein|nr:MAG: MCE family protein [Bacteroidetes bacterium HGW-Bacteroidetes-9]